MMGEGGSRRGMLWGAAVGLVLAMLIMWIGLGWTLFLILAALIGALVGSRVAGEVWRSQWDEIGQRLDRWWSERGR